MISSDYSILDVGPDAEMMQNTVSQLYVIYIQ